MSTAEHGVGPAGPGTADVHVRSAAAAQCRRYVLQVDLPAGAPPAMLAEVDAAVGRVARDLCDVFPSARSQVEVLASVGARAAVASASASADESLSPAPGLHAVPPVRRHQVPVLEVDLDARRVFVGEHLVQLAFKEFEILRLLVGRPGSVVTRDEIAARIGHGEDRPAPRTIDVHVHRIRAKLAETGDCISTVRGLGYRFNPSSSVVVA